MKTRSIEVDNAENAMALLRREKSLLHDKFDKLKSMYEELRDEYEGQSNTRRSQAYVALCDDVRQSARASQPRDPLRVLENENSSKLSKRTRAETQ